MPSPPSLDGTPAIGTSSGTPVVLTLSTTNANDIIIVAIEINFTSSVSITDTAGLTWLPRVASGANDLETYYAIAPSPLSSDAITVTCAGSVFIAAVAFAVSGVNTTSPFDGTPVVGDVEPVDPLSITTSNPNTFIFATYRQSSTASPVAGAGLIQIAGANFQLVEYTTSTVPTTVSMTVGSPGVSDTNGGIADALVALLSTSLLQPQQVIFM